MNYRICVEHREIGFVSVSQDQWRQLRGAWLDMITTQPSDDAESLDVALVVPESGWRERIAALTDIDCFAEALADESGEWFGFVSGYFDDLSLDRTAYVTHLHAVHGGVETEALLLDRVAQWAALYAAEALVVGIREDRVAMMERFEDHGFRRTGVRRRCDLDPGRDEIELVFDLAARSLDAHAPHRSLRAV